MTSTVQLTGLSIELEDKPLASLSLHQAYYLIGRYDALFAARKITDHQVKRYMLIVRGFGIPWSEALMNYAEHIK